MNIIPFSPPYIDQDVIDEVLDALNSGWITTGPKVKKLEEAFAAFCAVNHVVAVNSWTSGAILVMKWFGIGPGDEVIIPAYTYSATALSVLHCGATPIMVDVREDFNIDPDAIRAKITNKTKIIMPVDFGGLMCDYDAINNLVKESAIQRLFEPSSKEQVQLGRIMVVADAAHSLGAYYKGKNAGEATDVTIFSLHAVKNVTSAEGGMICLNLPEPFNSEEVYKSMRLWSLNGQTKDAFAKSKAGGWRYDVLFQGLKVNMPDLNAAIALAQMRKYKSKMLPKRLEIAETYQAEFEKNDWAITPIIRDAERISCGHLYPLRIKNISEEQRDLIISKIADQGVSVNVHFIPLPMLTVFKELGFDILDFPIAFRMYSNEISLPIYPDMENETIKRVCSVVIDAVESVIE